MDISEIEFYDFRVKNFKPLRGGGAKRGQYMKDAFSPYTPHWIIRSGA